MPIIVGGVIKKDNKYLLVKEAQMSCYGKWNWPAGWLDNNEILIEGVAREIKEETGCDVELTGICQIGNKRLDDNVWISLIFTTNLINDEIKYDYDEILDVQWFTYEEIVAMKDELRIADLIIGAIDNVNKNIVAPLEIIEVFK